MNTNQLKFYDKLGNLYGTDNIIELSKKVVINLLNSVYLISNKK